MGHTEVSTMPVLRIAVSVFLLPILASSTSAPNCSTGWYGPLCNMPCGDRCKGNQCQADPEAGTFRCTSGCAGGWMGSYCHRKCPTNCLACDQDTGACSICATDWCGRNCSALCDNTENGNGTCLDESCTHCIQGWYGPSCVNRCPEHCDGDCEKSSGICFHQCSPRYRGNLCTKPCSTTCRDGCRQDDGVCYSGCQSGWYGDFCNFSCDATCKDDVCYQQSGECALGVVSPNSISQHCMLVFKGSEVTPDCRKGCQPGWRGERCDRLCPVECFSCPRFPTGTPCLYYKEVTDIRTFNLLDEHKKDNIIGDCTLFAFVLVLCPFAIVGIVWIPKLFLHALNKLRRRNRTFIPITQFEQEKI